MKAIEIKNLVDDNRQVQCGIGDFYVYIVNSNRWISDEPMYAVGCTFCEQDYFESENIYEAYVKFVELKEELINVVSTVEVI